MLMADITKSYCYHNVSSPIMSSNVLGRPRLIDYIDFLITVLAVLAEACHEVEKNGENMADEKV